MSEATFGAPDVPGTAAGSPWLGLQSYEEQHQALFFGRDADSSELLRLVKRGVLTVLYGVSGLGKTSLLNAGLFPLLRQHGYLPIPIRLSAGGTGAPEPLVLLREAIAGQIAAHCADTPAPTDAETLWEYFHRTAFRHREDRAQRLTPVLVFDQFEEVIRGGARDPGRRALYEELSDLIENFIPVSVRERVERSAEELPFHYDSPAARVIFSLREDYLGQLQELKPLIPSLMRNAHHLKPMSGTHAAEAVIKPARQAHLLVPDDVAERIVRIAAGEVAAGPGQPRPSGPLAALEVEPALLSLFCDELNRTRVDRGLPAITAELTRGERGSILSGFYESRTKNLPLNVKRFIEEELLTKEGHRKSAVEEDLPDDIRADVNALIDARLLRRDTPAGRPSYVELMHDVLAEPVVTSRNERRQQEAVEEERHRQEEARRETSARLKQQRYRTRVLAVASAICLALMVGALFAMEVARQARDREKDARGELLAVTLAAEADSLGSVADSWVDSTLLAVESIKRRMTPRTSAAWAAAIDRMRVDRVPVGAPPTALAFSRDGTLLGIASVDGALRVWDLDRRKERARLGASQGFAAAMVFSPDGSRLVTAGNDSLLRVWDVAGGKELAHLQSHAKSPKALSFDGKRATGVDSDNRVWVWEVERGTLIVTPVKHPSAMTAGTVVALSADGHRMATADRGSWRVWDVDGAGEVVQMPGTGSPVTAMVFSADGRRLATLHQDLRMRIWDLQRGTRLMEWESPSPVTTMALSPNGQRLATGHWSEQATLWTLQSPTELSRLPFEMSLKSLAFSPNATRLLVVAADGTTHAWDVARRSEIPAPPLITEGTGDSVTAVALSSDGTRMATTSADYKTRMWYVDSGRSVPLEHPSVATAVAFSPDGARLATGSIDARARVVTWEKGQSQMELKHPERVLAVAFSPDGRRLATGSTDRSARVWDLDRSSDSPIELEHGQDVNAVAFSPDGKRLATVTADNTARVWEVASGKELVRLPHRKPIRSVVAFSPRGDRVLTVDFDNVVREWPLTSDEMVRLACSSLPRNLARADRRRYVGDEGAPATCSNLPEED